MNVLVAATLNSGPAHSLQADVGFLRQRRGIIVGDGDRRNAGAARVGLEREHVRAHARLRDGDEQGVAKLEPGAVDRHDRGADRAAGNAGVDLEQILEIARGMIGGAAGAGDDVRGLPALEQRRRVRRTPPGFPRSMRATTAGASAVSRAMADAVIAACLRAPPRRPRVRPRSRSCRRDSGSG